VLCCAVLCCAVLCCAVLCCAVCCVLHWVIAALVCCSVVEICTWTCQAHKSNLDGASPKESTARGLESLNHFISFQNQSALSPSPAEIVVATHVVWAQLLGSHTLIQTINQNSNLLDKSCSALSSRIDSNNRVVKFS
jgi:hypothetical protein